MYKNPIDVLILSAGKGSRTKTQFKDTPKALITHNNMIALDIVCNIFSRHSIFKINLNVREDEVSYFDKYNYPLLIESTPLGNAGAIKKFGRSLSDPFLVSHNDIDLRDLDVATLFNKHIEYQSLMTMTVKNIAEPKERGVIIKRDHTVLGLTRERLVNCGIYCVSRKALDYIADGFQDIDVDLLPALLSFGALSCYEYNGFYEDWGR